MSVTMNGTCDDRSCVYRASNGYCMVTVCQKDATRQTTAFRFPNFTCYWCGELENGDTLYKRGSFDHGMTFEEIDNIKYCPVCGRELKVCK